MAIDRPASVRIAHQERLVGHTLAFALGSGFAAPAIVADAVAHDRGVDGGRIEAHAVEAVAPDLVAVDGDLVRGLVVALDVVLEIAVAAVVADAVAAHRIGPDRVADGNAVAAVAVERAVGKQPAAAADARDALRRDVEADFVVLAHHARAHHQAVGTPVGNAVAVVDAVAAGDLDAARRRPLALLQLDEDAVGGIADADAVVERQALDRPPAADADADARAAGLPAIVEASAVHRHDVFEHRVLQVIAAKAGGGRIEDVDVAEGAAHHVLEVKPLGARVVLPGLHPRALDLEIGEGAIGEMVRGAGAIQLFVKARQRHRLPAHRIGEHEARRAGARADQRDAASPDGHLIGDQVIARRYIDHARPVVARELASEALDERSKRGLVVGYAVADEAVLARVADVVFLIDSGQRQVHGSPFCKRCSWLESSEEERHDPGRCRGDACRRIQRLCTVLSVEADPPDDRLHRRRLGGSRRPSARARARAAARPAARLRVPPRQRGRRGDGSDRQGAGRWLHPLLLRFRSAHGGAARRQDRLRPVQVVHAAGPRVRQRQPAGGASVDALP